MLKHFGEISQLCLPSVNYGNNTSSVLGNVLENRLREIKVVIRRVTPASWRAEVSGCDHNGARQAPLWVIDTPELIACTTAQAIVKQCSAQCCCVNTITLAI